MKLTVKKWRERILRSLELQKVRREEAERFMRAYAGDYNNKPKKDIDGSKDDASVNFIFSFVETVRPTILPGTPKAFMEAEDPESEPAADGAQGLVNHFAKKLGIKAEFKSVIEDWFYGFAAFLSEWDYSEEPVYKPGTDEQEVEEDSITEENPEGEPKFNILKDQPLAERLDPWDVVYDADSKTRKKDKWRARRIIFTYQEFRALPGLTKALRKKVRPRTIPKELQRGGEDGDNYSTEKNYVICWRIYDLENYCTKLMVDVEGIDDFVEDIPWPWEMDAFGDRFPITILEAKRDSSSPYSFSQFKAYWNQLQERNTLRSIIKSTVRRNAPGWFAKKGAMDEEQKSKFIGSKIGEYSEANDPTGITIKPQFTLAPDFFAHDNQVAEDTIEVSGLVEYRADASGGTATEASIQNQKSSIRKGEAKSDFNEFTATVYMKIFQLCQQFLQEEKAVKIRTPKGPTDYTWLKLNKTGIQGNFHMTVKPNNDELEDEGLRKQQDLKFAELMAQNPHVDQRKLAIRISKRHDIEPDEILRPIERVQAEQAAMAAAEAAKNAPKDQEKDKMPLIDFSAIKVELLAPQVQAMIIAAALKQNEVPQTLGTNGGAPGPVPGTQAGGLTPSVADPLQNSVMPGAEINQAPPPNPGTQAPPATPVMPMSEMQGGRT